MIYWLGNDTPHWKNPRRYNSGICVAAGANTLMPLTEDDVLGVAFGSHEGYRRVSRAAAINCTSRLALRVALAHTGLNPKWKPFPYTTNAVIKQPASAASSGVVLTTESDETFNLRRYAPELADWGVVEEPVAGSSRADEPDQYEIDGVVLDGRIHAFEPIGQWWRTDGAVIWEYRLVERPDGLYGAAERAIHALGIDNAPFCLELRYSGVMCGWKLIDAHCRLGEDGPAYREVLNQAAGGGPFYVIDQLERDAIPRRASRP